MTVKSQLSYSEEKILGFSDFPTRYRSFGFEPEFV